MEADFPAWCRLTSNEPVSFVMTGRQRSFLVCKGPLSGRAATRPRGRGATTPSSRRPRRPHVDRRCWPSFPSARCSWSCARRARRAVALFGEERVLLTLGCGFATFAGTPITPADVVEAKLRALVEAADLLRRGR